jgi:hypothetical protein
VTEKEGINHDAAGTDRKVPDKKNWIGITANLKKPG